MIKLMNKPHTQERIIVVLLICIAIALNVFVWVGKWSQTPAGHTFIPTHNSLSDYAFYVSVIRQGMDGEYGVYDRFAVEQHGGSAIHLLYLLIGWVGSAFGFTSAHIVYHIVRYSFGIVWAVTIYWLLSVTIKEKWVRICAFACSLFSASFPYITWANGIPSPNWFMTWWSELDPVIRVAFIPHFTAGHIMMVTAFICVSIYVRFVGRTGPILEKTRRTQTQPKQLYTWWHKESVSGKRWIVRAFVSAWIAAFVHPPSAIQLLLVLPLYCMFLRTRKSVEVGFAVCIGALSGLLIINSISNVFPWNLPRAFEGWSFALSIKEYVLALGPVVLLAIVGVAYKLSPMISTVRLNRELRIKNTEDIIHNSSFILLSLWIFTSFIMLKLSLLMPFSSVGFIRAHPISNIRFLQVAVWIPLSIFAAYGVSAMAKKLPQMVMGGIGIVLFTLTFIGYPATIAEQVSHMYFTSQYQYPERGYLQGIEALKTITTPSQSIMSLSLAGMTIPTYINRSVYVGQVVYTPDIDKKLSLSWKFYSGGLPICEAYELVMKNSIGAVFYSFDEQQAGEAVKYYPFLQPWNTYGSTQIFDVVDVNPEGCGK